MNRDKLLKEPADVKEEPPKWLITFNDLMTLLMVFFVLLFAMGSVDVKMLKTFQNSLQSALGVLEEGQKVSIEIPDTGPTYGKEDQEKIEDPIKALDLEPEISVTYTKEGIVITLEDKVLFTSGIADINPDAYPILDTIGAAIKKMPESIRVEGHTDNDAIRTDRFPSNWELSTARAVNVVRYFVESGKIPPRRLSAVGYGEAKALFPNDTPEHKAKNRRVEIILVKEEEN